ncbi:MAG: PilZ domain-containing protein [Planctomycetota bacterium]
MSTTNKDDSRHSTRFFLPGVRIDCNRKTRLPLFWKHMDVRLRDISHHGLQLSSDDVVRRGWRVRGRVTLLKTRESVAFGGMIRWVRYVPGNRYGRGGGTIFGVEITGIRAKDAVKLEAIGKLFTSKRYLRTRGQIHRG